MIEDLFKEYFAANDDYFRMALEQRILRELKWSHVENHLIPILDEMDYTFAIDRGRGSVNIWNPDGVRFIYFPMKDRLLITADNEWKSGGMRWMQKNISKDITPKFFNVQDMLSNYKEKIH